MLGLTIVNIIAADEQDRFFLNNMIKFDVQAISENYSVFYKKYKLVSYYAFPFKL